MAKSYKVTVTATELNIRKQPNTTSKVLGTVKKGTSLTASKVDGKWYYVQGKGGWLSGTYLKVETASGSTSSKKSTKSTTTKKKDDAKKTYKQKLEESKKKLDKLKKKAKSDIADLTPRTYKVNKEADREWMKPNFIKKKINPNTTIVGKGKQTDGYDDHIITTSIKGLAEKYKGKMTAYTNVNSSQTINITENANKSLFNKRTVRQNAADKKPATSEELATAEPGPVLKTLGLGSSNGKKSGSNDVGYVDNQGSVLRSLTQTGVVDKNSSFLDYSPTSSYEDSIGSDAELAIILKNIDYLDYNSYKRVYTEMNRFGLPFHGTRLNKTKSYIFFTRPTCHLFGSDGQLTQEAMENPVFRYIHGENPMLLKSITSKLSDSHGFNPFLSNSAESMEIADEVIKTIEHGETYTGWKNVYARNTNESNTASQFAVTYTEDLETNVYRIHKAWIEYMNLIMKGQLKSTRYAITNKVLDYSCAVYYFLCDADGETILFWNKYTGVFPLNTPASGFSYTKGSPVGNVKHTINYSYAMREQLDPQALAEFNYVARGEKYGSFADIYNSSGYAMHNATMVGMPYVAFEENSAGGVGRYKLKFRRSIND